MWTFYAYVWGPDDAEIQTDLTTARAVCLVAQYRRSPEIVYATNGEDRIIWDFDNNWIGKVPEE